MKRCIVLLAGAGLAAALATGAAAADKQAEEFHQILKETGELYDKGETGEVKKNLEYLMQVVASMRVSSIADFLPKPLDGWTAEEADKSAMGAAMLGGGLSASKRYEKGGQDVQISIVGDSPMLAQMSMIFSNPMIANSSGGKIVRIGRDQAMVQDDQITMMIGNRWMVTANGSAGEEAKIDYLKAIDSAGLKSFE